MSLLVRALMFVSMIVTASYVNNDAVQFVMMMIAVVLPLVVNEHDRVGIEKFLQNILLVVLGLSFVLFVEWDYSVHDMGVIILFSTLAASVPPAMRFLSTRNKV